MSAEIRYWMGDSEDFDDEFDEISEGFGKEPDELDAEFEEEEVSVTIVPMMPTPQPPVQAPKAPQPQPRAVAPKKAPSGPLPSPRESLPPSRGRKLPSRSEPQRAGLRRRCGARRAEGRRLLAKSQPRAARVLRNGAPSGARRAVPSLVPGRAEGDSFPAVNSIRLGFVRGRPGSAFLVPERLPLLLCAPASAV